MHLIVYCRVSSITQARNENPISTQKAACLDYVKRGGHTIDEANDIYIDAGISGRRSDRKDFQAMMARLKADPLVEGVVAYDISRIFRDTGFYLEFMKVVDQSGKKFFSVSENTDDRSPAGKLTGTMLAAAAEFFSNQMAEKIRLGMHNKAINGIYPAKAPYGYKNVQSIENGKDSRWIEPEPQEAQVVREVFNLYATGQYSFVEIAEKMNERGIPTTNLRPWRPHGVEDILKNRIYIGWIIWSTIANPNGKHERLVDEELFYRVQATIEARNYGANRKRKYQFLLRGVSFCGECGSRITAYHKEKNGKTYSYYGCQKHKRCAPVQCDQSGMRLKDVEKQLERIIKTIQMPEKYCNDIVRKVKDFIKRDSLSSDEERKATAARVENAKSQKRLLLEKYVEGKIESGEYESYKSELELKERQAKTELASLDSKGESVISIVETAAELLKDCYRAYKKASFENKVILIQTMFERVTMQDGGITGIVLKHPFVYICKPKTKKNSLFQLGTLGGRTGSAIELFDVLAENAEAMQTWNAFMQAFMAQERKEDVLSVTF